MLLFDTDVLIDYLRGNAHAVALLESRAGEPFSISAVTVAELHAGARPEELPALNDFLRVFAVVPVDAALAARAGELRRRHRAVHGTGLADAIIAAAAQVSGASLVTLNTRHYPMFPGLEPPYRKTT